MSKELRDAQPSRSLIVRSSDFRVLARPGSDSAILAQRDKGRKIKGWTFKANKKGLVAHHKDRGRLAQELLTLR